MTRLLNRGSVLVVAAAIIISPVTWLMSTSLRGHLRARYDVDRGHYRVLTLGPILGGFLEYQQILRERYGIEVQAVGGCVSFWAASYADAYDKVSMPAIAHKFGRDVLKNSWDEATKTWQKKHQAELQNVSRSE